MSTYLLWTAKNVVAFLAEATITEYFPSVMLGANSCATWASSAQLTAGWSLFTQSRVLRQSVVHCVRTISLSTALHTLLQASLVRVKMALKACKLLQFCCYNMNLWPSWHVYPSQREGSLLCSSLSGFFFCLVWVFFYPFWVEGVSSALNVRQTVIVNFGCTYVIWLIDYLIDRLTPPQGVIHSAPWSDIP